ncbi:hypothetical protein BSKO_12489 [Bryopsis sp. KO-2023]|nr:hypothetical protein BSKO_12489 [Bryopsis sp. KO-2023]
MHSASLAAVSAAILLISVTAQEEQDCDSGPPPPGDLGAFIWVRSGFEPGGNADDQAARDRLGVDFLCQTTIDRLWTTSSAVVPIPSVDFGTACRVPLEDACNLLSSCSSGRTLGTGRRLTQQCMPFFGCSLSVPPPSPLAEGEILVEPPNIEYPNHSNVLLGLCFEGSCSILSVAPVQGEMLGALAYRLCSEKYVHETVNGWTALHWAATMGTGDVVKFSIKTLVENGAELEARDDQGFTPMHLASKFGFPAPFQALLDAGADIEAMDNAGNTPLAIASFFKQDLVSEVLLGAGANPNVKYVDGGNKDTPFDPNSKAPLHFAALYSRRSTEPLKRVVEALIKAGADVNVVDDEGNTPLQIAEEYGRLEMIRILKENGAR